MCADEHAKGRSRKEAGSISGLRRRNQFLLRAGWGLGQPGAVQYRLISISRRRKSAEEVGGWDRIRDMRG